MRQNIRFSLLGGDRRMAQLAALLAHDGHIVYTYGLEGAPVSQPVLSMPAAHEAVREAECVIWPLPMCQDDRTLLSPLALRPIPLETALDILQPGQYVVGGRIPAGIYPQTQARGVDLTDVLTREDFAVKNAIPSVEGALQILMEETTYTLHGAVCLVIGFGRLGKLLARHLKALGASVTVSARKFEDFAWIEAEGYHSLDTRKLDGHLGSFSIVVNTVPARVLGEGRVQELQSDCYCLDLASQPGGFDTPALERRGLRFRHALSLPGKVAPDTAAAILRDTVYNILTEKGLCT